MEIGLESPVGLSSDFNLQDIRPIVAMNKKITFFIIGYRV
jgi:hypothetical protein